MKNFWELLFKNLASSVPSWGWMKWTMVLGAVVIFFMVIVPIFWFLKQLWRLAG